MWNMKIRIVNKKKKIKICMSIKHKKTFTPYLRPPLSVSLFPNPPKSF